MDHDWTTLTDRYAALRDEVRAAHPGVPDDHGGTIITEQWHALNQAEDAFMAAIADAGQTRPLTQAEVLFLLADSDHDFLTLAFAQHLADPFGVTATPTREIANTANPKGVFVPDAGPGTPVWGVDATDLANAIARHLDPAYINPMMGRGSALRHALASILESLGWEHRPGTPWSRR